MLPTIHILGRDVTPYGIMALIGIFTAGVFACLQVKKRGWNDNKMLTMLLIAAAGVLFGSHLLYFLVTVRTVPGLDSVYRAVEAYGVYPVLASLFGGSVFYGGLLGGLLAGWLYLRRQREEFSLFIDIGTCAIPLFHTFGRIGCFLGGCCYGIPSSVGFTARFAPVAEANGVQRFPVQLLEASMELLIFLLLFHLLRAERLRGRLLPLYLVIYPVGRFFLEFLRGDAIRGFIGPLSTSQWISAILFFPALYFLLRRDAPAEESATQTPA